MNDNPLTRTDLSALNKCQSACNDCLTRIQQAEAAGIDVSELKEQLQYLQHRADQFKRIYFPQMR